jgi:colanic acid/amylovoran biosynthesis glycosyltransferase
VKGTNHARPVVAHVNYSFFHSTQSFIYFYLVGLRRVHPICLTRGRESPAIRAEVPASLGGDFYAYTGSDGRRSRLWPKGIGIRRALTRLPGGTGERALGVLQRRVVPRVRPDTDPSLFADWAEVLMRNREAQLIHAYSGPVAWRMLALRRRLGVPLVVSFLGDEVAPSLSPWWSWWIRTPGQAPDWPARLRELFGEADLLLAEGPFLRDRLIELGCPPEKVEVQRIAIPVADMPFRARATHPGRPVVMFAGRFCEQKGLLQALEAVRDLRRAGRDLEFRMIGDDTLTDGGYAARVNAYIRHQGLEDTVTRLGFLNHDRYIEEMQRADVFLHPSVVDSEGAGEGGAPTTILEAQALGMPVVSTTHCDIPNVTVPGESAVLVPERDVEALATALGGILDDPGRWEAMGRAGRTHVEANHDIVTEAERLEDRYVALLSRRAA